MVNRIVRDDPSKGDMHNRQALSPSLFWEAIKDYDMWPIYLIGLSKPHKSLRSMAQSLTSQSLEHPTNPLPVLHHTHHRESRLQHLRNEPWFTVPGYALFIIQLLTWTWISEKVNNRFGIVLVSQLWMLPILIALELLPGGAAHSWARYALNLMLVGYPYIHAILGECWSLEGVWYWVKGSWLMSAVAMTSRNAGSVRTRTVGSALYNMCVQASNIIASNVCSMSMSLSPS